MENNPTLQPTTQVSQNSDGNNKMILWLVLGLVFTILIVGVVYFYLNNQQSKQPTAQAPNYTQPQDNLQTDLNSIDTSDTGSQFSEVDKDLNSL